MRAKDVMTTNVITVSPETPLSEIVRLMLENRISAVPVVDPDGNLSGIVSEGDLLRRPEIGTERKLSWLARMFEGEEGLAREFVRSHGHRAREVMTADVITVGPEASLEEIARTMEENRIKRVVVTRDNRIEGMVSRADLLRGLAVAGVAPAGRRPNDQDIRAEIVRSLGAAGLGVGEASVTVSDGVVHLWGTVRTPAQREALRVAAEGAPGVKGVEDHLVVVTALGWGE